MPLLYEALVGHLFVVNRRALSTNPPGARVEAAPPGAARGREADTFFVLVLPAENAPVAPTAFYERMATLATSLYFETPGSVTAGLRAVCDTLNGNLVQHNTQAAASGGRTFFAGLVCAALHDDTVTVAHVGSGLALLHQAETTHLFPADPLDANTLVYSVALGGQPQADVRLRQFDLQSGARLLLAEARAAAHLPALRASLGASDIGAALMELKATLSDQAALMLAEFLPPGAPAPVPVREGTNSVAALHNTRETVPTAPVAVDDGVGTRVVETAAELKDRAQRGLSTAAIGVAKGTEVTNQLIDHYFGAGPDEPKNWWATPVLAGAALVIPLVVVGLVLLLWLTGIGRSDFEACVQEAANSANTARQIDPADVNTTLLVWDNVLAKVEECEGRRQSDEPDTTLIALEREGQGIIDRLLNITRRDATTVASFVNANLTRVVLRGLNLYVLDSANHYVYEMQLSQDGRSTVGGSGAPIVNMRRGAPVNQYTLTDLIDITWAEDGTGLSQGNVLVALDRNGVLVEHSPTILTRGVQQLIGTENWQNPVAVRIWRGRLYLLDPAANQIWRYEPTNGSYSGAPEEYFTGQNRPIIRDAVDFDIDNDGDVYVLYASGQLGIYRGGDALNFGFVNFPAGQELVSAQAMFLSTSPIAQGLFIVSPTPNHTIFETTTAGTFVRSYRPHEETLFTGLNNVVVDPGQQLIYALSGNSVFALSREG